MDRRIGSFKAWINGMTEISMAATKNSAKPSSEFRIKRFRYSVASSLASKVTTAAVQIVALPIAAISLGVHGYALYVMLTAAVGWLALSNLGVGPILAVRLAAAHARDDLEAERCVFSSAFFPTLVLSAIVFLVVVFAVWTLPVHNIFGPLYIADVHTIRLGLTALVSIFFLQTNVSLFESAQAGYQEQFVQNLVATISSIPVLLAVWFVTKHNPTPVEIILAINLPALLFRCANVVAIMWRHPQVRPLFTAFHRPLCKDLVRSGAIFSLAGGAGNFLAHILPVILVGRSFNSEVSASFAATMNAIILASGMISMVSTPLWPAIADSVAKGERNWAGQAYRRLLWSVMALGLLTALFLGTRGEWLFHVWFKGQISPSRNLILAAGIYFVALCWESVHFNILIGLHRITTASVLLCVRSVLGVVATVIFMHMENEAIPFISMSIAVIIVDLIPLRKIVLSNL